MGVARELDNDGVEVNLNTTGVLAQVCADTLLMPTEERGTMLIVKAHVSTVIIAQRIWQRFNV